jgi:hypothetical protein
LANCGAIGAACNQAFGCGHGRVGLRNLVRYYKKMERSVITKGLAVAVVAVAAVLAVGWIVTRERADVFEPMPPFELRRDADGQWPDGPKVRFESGRGLAIRQTTTSTSSTQGIVVTRGGRLALASVLVQTETDSRMEHLAAVHLALGLAQIPEVQEIRFEPFGSEVEGGGERPDLVFAVERRQPGLGHAALRFVATTQLHRGPGGGVAADEPIPGVDVRIEVDVECTIRRAERYPEGGEVPELSETLAQQAVEGIVDSLREALQKYGTVPALPATFVVPYRDVEPGLQLASLFPGSVDLRRLAAWRAPLVHHESWWRGTAPGPWRVFADGVGERLRVAGFAPTESNAFGALHYQRGRITIVVGDETRERAVAGGEDRPGLPVPFYVRVRELADEEGVRAAFASLFADDVPVSTRLFAARHLEAADRARMLEHVAQRPLADPLDLLARAELRIDCGDDAGVLPDLRDAHALAEPGFGQKATLEAIADVARKRSIPEAALEPTAESCRALGFVELRAGDEPAVFDLGPDRRRRLFCEHEGRLCRMLVALAPDGQVALCLVSGGSRAESIRPMRAGSMSTGFGTLHYEVLANAQVRVHFL